MTFHIVAMHIFVFISGKTVSAGDYEYIQRLGVSDVNVKYGVCK